MQKGKLLLIAVWLIFINTAAKAQSTSKSNNGTFYLAFGTNLSSYSKSDIHLKRYGLPAFDFTLKNVRGKDDGGLSTNGGAPQYSLQLGYYSHRKNWGVEFNFDHIKYFIRQNQRVEINGTINNVAYQTDTLITPQFISLEHSDGANYALLKIVKWLALKNDANKRPLLNLVLKAGAGPVIPKTNSTIMGNHWDDRYHIAGYVIAFESGLRYNISKFLFAEGNAKWAYANYKNFLISNGSGSQQWYGLHASVLFGVQF